MTEDLEGLRALAELSPQLVAAAERQDWDALAELAPSYFEGFARLGDAPAGPDEATERARLIRRLLDDQARIRAEVEPWLRSTGKLLGTWGAVAARRAAADS